MLRSITKLRTLGHKLGPPRRDKLRLPEKKAESFYTSPEWRALMDSIIKVRGRVCEDPRHDPEKPRKGGRIFGDHIKERKDGGAPLNPRNVMLRCGSCHSRKTAAERAKRYQGEGGSNL